MPPYWRLDVYREDMVVVAELGVRLGVGQFARERCVTVGIDVANAMSFAQEMLRGGFDSDNILRE